MPSSAFANAMMAGDLSLYVGQAADAFSPDLYIYLGSCFKLFTCQLATCMALHDRAFAHSRLCQHIWQRIHENVQVFRRIRHSACCAFIASAALKMVGAGCITYLIGDAGLAIRKSRGVANGDALQLQMAPGQQGQVPVAHVLATCSHLTFLSPAGSIAKKVGQAQADKICPRHIRRLRGEAPAKFLFPALVHVIIASMRQGLLVPERPFQQMHVAQTMNSPLP